MVGLEKITNRIISDANAEAEKILAEAQARCDEISRKAEQKCEDIRSGIEAEAVAECENIKSRSISGMAMYRRDVIMNARVKILDAAFAKARDEILSMGADKYKELLSSLLCRVLEEQLDAERESLRLYGEDISPESYEVIMNRTDRESFGVYVIAGVRRGTIGKITGDVLQKVHLSENVAEISGGIILRCGDIEINSSLDTMLAELRPKLEAEVEAELARYIELNQAEEAEETENTVETEEIEETKEIKDNAEAEITEIADMSTTDDVNDERIEEEQEDLDELSELSELADAADIQALSDLERLSDLEAFSDLEEQASEDGANEDGSDEDDSDEDELVGLDEI